MKKKYYYELLELSISDLEKRKLIEEILEIKKPIWKKISFISVTGTLLLTIAAVGVSIWQIQESKIKVLEEEKDALEEKTKEVERKENAAMIQFNEAISEKATAESEKAQAISEKTIINQKIRNWELSQKEQELQESIKRFRKINEELKKKSNNYKRAFIETFVDKNNTVRKDIERFTNEVNRDQFQTWLKEKFLWTALTRYEDYILDEVENASQH